MAGVSEPPWETLGRAPDCGAQMKWTLTDEEESERTAGYAGVPHPSPSQAIGYADQATPNQFPAAEFGFNT